MRVSCTELLNGYAKVHNEILSAEEIIQQFKALQEENKLLLSTQYITENTYCISDIAQKFKDLSPMQAQHELYNEDYLEYRKNGLFPTEFYDKNNTIVSVLDTERNRYYPRYTSKGVIMVENYFLDKGYKFKG